MLVLREDRADRMRRKKRKKIVIGVLVITVIVLAMGIGFFMTKGTSEVFTTKGTSTVEFGTVQKDSKKEIEARLKNKADPSVLAVSMEQSITMKNGKEEANLNIENMPENNYDIAVEITRAEDKERIYYAKDLEPGYIIRTDKLEKELKKGTHLCNATFRAFDEEGTEVKSANAKIEIIVEN